jgi:hypothetical protein
MQPQKGVADFRRSMALIVIQVTAERIHLVNGIEQPTRLKSLTQRLPFIVGHRVT